MADTFDGYIRLCDRGRRLRRVRARQPAERRCRHQRLRARSRPERLASLHPSAGRLHQDLSHEEHQLGLPAGAGSLDRGPQHLRAARQDARRLLLDQRAHLQSWPAPGFRHLGAARQSRLGLSGCAAVFQAAGAAGRRGRGHLSRARRQSDRHHHGLAGSALRGVHGRRDEPRHSAQPRLQRRDPGGRILRPAHDSKWPARQRRDRLPASGDETAERPCAHPCACDRDHVRRQARDRRALRQGRQGRHADRSARGQGSDPRRRHLQLAATAAIVGHRLARTCCARSASRCATRWPASARDCRTITRRVRSPASRTSRPSTSAGAASAWRWRRSNGRRRGAACSRCRRPWSIASGTPARPPRAPICN